MLDKDQILLENLYNKILETDGTASMDTTSSETDTYTDPEDREEETKEETKEETSADPVTSTALTSDSFINVYLNVLEAVAGSKPCPCKKVDGKCVKKDCECKQCEKEKKDK